MPGDADAAVSAFQDALQPRKLTLDRDGELMSLHLAIEDSNDVREKIFDISVANGFKILGLSSSGSDLEKIFRELTVGSDETGQQ